MNRKPFRLWKGIMNASSLFTWCISLDEVHIRNQWVFHTQQLNVNNFQTKWAKTFGSTLKKMSAADLADNMYIEKRKRKRHDTINCPIMEHHSDLDLHTILLNFFFSMWSGCECFVRKIPLSLCSKWMPIQCECDITSSDVGLTC